MIAYLFLASFACVGGAVVVFRSVGKCSGAELLALGSFVVPQPAQPLSGQISLHLFPFIVFHRSVESGLSFIIMYFCAQLLTFIWFPWVTIFVGGLGASLDAKLP